MLVSRWFWHAKSLERWCLQSSLWRGVNQGQDINSSAVISLQAMECSKVGRDSLTLSATITKTLLSKLLYWSNYRSSLFLNIGHVACHTWTCTYPWPKKVKVGWLCCSGIVWEPIRKTNSHGTLQGNTHPVISAHLASVGWSWPTEWNKCMWADLHCKKKSVGNESLNLPPSCSHTRKIMYKDFFVVPLPRAKMFTRLWRFPL